MNKVTFQLWDLMIAIISEIRIGRDGHSYSLDLPVFSHMGTDRDHVTKTPVLRRTVLAPCSQEADVPVGDKRSTQEAQEVQGGLGDMLFTCMGTFFFSSHYSHCTIEPGKPSLATAVSPMHVLEVPGTLGCAYF